MANHSVIFAKQTPSGGGGVTKSCTLLKWYNYKKRRKNEWRKEGWKGIDFKQLLLCFSWYLLYYPSSCVSRLLPGCMHQSCQCSPEIICGSCCLWPLRTEIEVFIFGCCSLPSVLLKPVHVHSFLIMLISMRTGPSDSFRFNSNNF